MNEESFKIIANQKRDIEFLNDYVDTGFKIMYESGKANHKNIMFLSFCMGFVGFVLYRQNKKIRKLEKQIKNDIVEDKLEKVTAE